MSPETLQISGNQTIFRNFSLPYNATVLVRIGQEVDAGEVIAEIKMPARYQIFDVINHFKINPQHIDRYLERLVGEPVKKGDVIAQKSGVIARIFRAPEDGMVVSIRNGKITLALGEKVLQVRATFPGTVVEVLPERGAVVAAQGALLQGEWGNGLNTSGELILLSQHEDSVKQSKDNETIAGKIAVVEHCANLEELKQLAKQGPAGLIFSSVMPAVLPAVENAPFPIMLLAGFGEFPLDALTSQLLKQMEGEKVYLNAHRADAMEGIRPEIILPGMAQVTTGLFSTREELEVGKSVRLLGKPYTGGTGKVIELPEVEEMFASGLVMPAVVVEREDGQIIRVPRENIEVIVE